VAGKRAKSEILGLNCANCRDNVPKDLWLNNMQMHFRKMNRRCMLCGADTLTEEQKTIINTPGFF